MTHDFERFVPGLCDQLRARVGTLPLPDDRRHPDADKALPTFRTTLPSRAELAGRTYELSRDAAEAANVALELGQPLLVTGEPGCGKTDLAYGLALQLGRPHVWRYDTTSVATADDVFYRFDHLARFHDAGVHREGRPEDYIELQAFGAAVASEQTEVVLLDEIDKAPRDFPNDLLARIEEPMYFRVREMPGTPWGHQRARHLVVITSNAERELPDPFLRRCVYVHLEFPSEPEALVKIVSRHLGARADNALVAAAVQRFLAVRGQVEKSRADARRPSTSEVIQWAKALHAARKRPADVESLPLSSALLKSTAERDAVRPRKP